MCNHLQIHSYEVSDHLVQHQTDFTCSGFTDSMVATCLPQPLLSGRFLTLQTAPEQPGGRERSLGAIPPLCFCPQESSADRGRCWRWNRVGKFVLLEAWQPKKKQNKKTWKIPQKGKEHAAKCRVDLLKVVWIQQVRCCRYLHSVRQPDLETFGNYVCGQAQISCLQGRSLTWKCPGSLSVAMLEGSCAGVFKNIWKKVFILHLLSLLFLV